MPEDGGPVLYIVAGKPIRRKPHAKKPKLPSKATSGLYVGPVTAATAPAAAATVRSARMEIFPEPGDSHGAIQWVKGPATALVRISDDRAISDQLSLADPAGRLFKVSQVQRLAAIPQATLHPLHGSPQASNLYDIILLSEGFASPEKEKFLAAAQRLSNDFVAIEPYHACRDRLRVTGLFLPSPESGISERSCGGSQHQGGICNAASQTRSTLFGMQNMVSGYCRLIAGNEDRIREALKTKQIRKLLANRHIEPQLAVVVGNTQLYGGAGASRTEVKPLVVWTAPNSSGGAVMAHEMGHALGLQDEYPDAGTGLPAPKKWVNISNQADPARTPWHCRATDHRTPTCTHHDPQCACDSDIIGTFEGAGHKPIGRYRPTKNCAMKTTGARFCPICAAHISNRLSGNSDKLCPPA